MHTYRYSRFLHYITKDNLYMQLHSFTYLELKNAPLCITCNMSLLQFRYMMCAISQHPPPPPYQAMLSLLKYYALNSFTPFFSMAFQSVIWQVIHNSQNSALFELEIVQLAKVVWLKLIMVDFKKFPTKKQPRRSLRSYQVNIFKKSFK